MENKDLFVALIFGSGIASVFLFQLIDLAKKLMEKKRIEKEIACELFKNEEILGQSLKELNCNSDVKKILPIQFSFEVINSIIISQLILYTDFDLMQFTRGLKEDLLKFESEWNGFADLPHKKKKSNLSALIKISSGGMMIYEEMNSARLFRKMRRKYSKDCFISNVSLNNCRQRKK